MEIKRITRPKISDQITQCIGNTPLVRLNKISSVIPGTIIAKLESFNPLSSSKDRIGLSMIENAEQKGLLKPGCTIIEPTSGNTGIAISYIAAMKGYKVIITMPDTMSIERIKMLKAFGAKVELTPGEQGMIGAIEKAKELNKKVKNSVILDQFKNPANPGIHERTTAVEIWQDTDGKVDYVVAGVGTGGTITGIAKTLKQLNPKVIAIAVEPEGSPVLSGEKPGPHKIPGIGAGFIPDVFDKSFIDEIIKVENEDAGNMTKKLAKDEGILAGISSGAALYAAYQVGKRKTSMDKNIIVILPDTGERYLSTWLFEE